MAQSTPASLFTGRWHIVSMDEWDVDYVEEEDPWTGRGWAVLEGDELHGMIFFHQSDESGFVAKRARQRKPRKRK
jgi:hypothetical protein